MSKGSVVVVGAGVVGLSCAWWLSRRGVPVTVLAEQPLAESASAGNAGLLSIGHAPLTKPGASIRGLRWMFNRRSPLHIRPRPDPALLRWLWGFHRHCTQAWFARCMATLGPMGFPAIEAIEAILAEERIDCDYARDGWLDVVLRPENMDHALREARSLEPWGYRHRVLDGAALRAFDPAFREEVAGAVHHLDSAHCHPGEMLAGLRDAVVRRGVTVRGSARVNGFLPAAGAAGVRGAIRGVTLEDGSGVEAETVILAAGVWSGALARRVGVRVPMQGARGYHVQLEGVPRVPRTGCVLHETFVAVTPMRRQVRLAGTLEIQPLGRPWMRERLEMLAAGACRYLHGITSARTVGEWAGYRPCTWDGMPVVGPVARVPGLWLATGHAMMGMTLGPVTGRLVAERLCGDPPCVPEPLLSIMAADRFG